MSKLKTILKKPARLWRRIFGFLPVISFGGTAFYSKYLRYRPKFYELHPCGGKTSFKTE